MPNKELIYREDLIAEYDRVHVGEPGGARKLMVDASAVDAVEVVRCKDCKYWETDKDYSQTAWCTFWTLDSTLLHTMATDFCSYGVRKVVDTDEVFC